MGTHTIPFSRELYIESDDFRDDPPDNYYRLSPGKEVRLRYGYFITCIDVEKDENTGEVLALHCTYDPETRGGHAPDNRRVRGTIHWVSAPHALKAEVRLYNHLFTVEKPEEVENYQSVLNPESVEILTSCLVEPTVANAPPETHYQFERLGYFCVDRRDSKPGGLVFNRTVTLRDTWAKINTR